MTISSDTVLLPAIGLPAVGTLIVCDAFFIGVPVQHSHIYKDFSEVLYHTKRRSVFISSHGYSKDVKAVTNPQYMW